MTAQINTLSTMGLLSRFVGMVTDSRSFLSYPRHEYFRRILCDLIGADGQRSAVRAAVHVGVDGAVLGAAHHHRRVADEGGFIVTAVRDLGFERDERPVLAAEDPPLLGFINGGVGEHAVGNAAAAGNRPGELRR